MSVKFSKLCFPRCYSSPRGMLSRDGNFREHHHQFYVPCIPSTSVISSLPEDIQVDIFLKLPLKSIGICRCVCKVWCALLRNPSFTKTHLRNADKDNSKLIFTGHDENKKLVFSSLDYASISSASSALPVSSTTCTCHGLILRDYPLIFIGTSSGRLENLCIWNPSTREYKTTQVPQCDFLDDTAKYACFYDCTVHFYKLGRISQNKNSGCYQAEVYTEGSESWETFLSNCTFRGLNRFSYRILNGAIYFPGFKPVNEVISSKVIVSFDMCSKKFVDLIFPEEVNPTSNASQILQNFVEVMNDRLHIVTYYPSVNRIDVWKMQDYGVKDSWTKLFTLTTDLITDIKYLKLQWTFASGEVLIENGNSKFLYDPKNDRIKVIEIQGIDLLLGFSMDYVESLVSLNSGTYLGKKTTVNKWIKNKD